MNKTVWKKERKHTRLIDPGQVQVDILEMNHIMSYLIISMAITDVT